MVRHVCGYKGYDIEVEYQVSRSRVVIWPLRSDTPPPSEWDREFTSPDLSAAIDEARRRIDELLADRMGPTEQATA
jgi:hypothetical protein